MRRALSRSKANAASAAPRLLRLSSGAAEHAAGHGGVIAGPEQPAGRVPGHRAEQPQVVGKVPAL